MTRAWPHSQVQLETLFGLEPCSTPITHTISLALHTVARRWSRVMCVNSPPPRTAAAYFLALASSTAPAFRMCLWPALLKYCCGGVLSRLCCFQVTEATSTSATARGRPICRFWASRGQGAIRRACAAHGGARLCWHAGSKPLDVPSRYPCACLMSVALAGSADAVLTGSGV